MRRTQPPSVEHAAALGPAGALICDRDDGFRRSVVAPQDRTQDLAAHRPCRGGPEEGDPGLVRREFARHVHIAPRGLFLCLEGVVERRADVRVRRTGDLRADLQ